MFKKICNNNILILVFSVIFVLVASGKCVYASAGLSLNLCDKVRVMLVTIEPSEPTSRDKIIVDTRWLFHATSYCIPDIQSTYLQDKNEISIDINLLFNLNQYCLDIYLGWIMQYRTVELGPLPPGDYTVTVNVSGQYLDGDNSSMPIYLCKSIEKDLQVISTKCKGDFDFDGNVDGQDLSLFADSFGRSNCKGDCHGDFDADGDVDGTDLAIFAADFGRTDCLE